MVVILFVAIGIAYRYGQTPLALVFGGLLIFAVLAKLLRTRQPPA